MGREMGREMGTRTWTPPLDKRARQPQNPKHSNLS